MNDDLFLVDSTGWLAFFMDDDLAGSYEPYLVAPEILITSTINIYEVCRRIEQKYHRKAAAEAVAQMQKTMIIAVSSQIATAAASISINHHLAMADAIILATSRIHQATLITSDAHFSAFSDVYYIPHPNRK